MSRSLCSQSAFPLLIIYINDNQMIRHVKLHIVVRKSYISPLNISQQLLRYYFHHKTGILVFIKMLLININSYQLFNKYFLRVDDNLINLP